MLRPMVTPSLVAEEPLTVRLRRQLGAAVIDNAFHGLSRIGRLHPKLRAEQARIRVVRDIPYRHTGHPAHRLDVHIPEGKGPWPIVLYVHGGGFRILSKETHWVMALAFARKGYLVVNIDYRLAPAHPFPAAIEDATHALRWTARHAHEYGGDPDRIVLAGESAGANLVTSLAIATCYERPEPFARALFDENIEPKAVVAACGLHEVGNVERFRKPNLPAWVFDRLVEVRMAYLDPSLHLADREGGLDLANPLHVLERGDRPAKPLPPFFASVGTADVLLDDTRRLAKALGALGTRCEARYYPREPHAFQAFLWRERARDCWRHTHDFLREILAEPEPLAGSRSVKR